MEKSYQVVGGTSYSSDTPLKVVEILESARTSGRKVRIFYGRDGKLWNDEHDTIGKIGRSMGPVKIPLLIHNSRSMGGGGLLDDRIVRIDARDRADRIVTLYKAEGYPDPDFRADGCVVRNADGSEGFRTAPDGMTIQGFYAICTSEVQAARLAGFMSGARWAK